MTESFFSRLYSLTAKTSRVPSGESSSEAGRFTAHRSSAVIARLEFAESAAKPTEAASVSAASSFKQDGNDMGRDDRGNGPDGQPLAQRRSHLSASTRCSKKGPLGNKFQVFRFGG